MLRQESLLECDIISYNTIASWHLHLHIYIGSLVRLNPVLDPRYGFLGLVNRDPSANPVGLWGGSELQVPLLAWPLALTLFHQVAPDVVTFNSLIFPWLRAMDKLLAGCIMLQHTLKGSILSRNLCR